MDLSINISLNDEETKIDSDDIKSEIIPQVLDKVKSDMECGCWCGELIVSYNEQIIYGWWKEI